MASRDDWPPILLVVVVGVVAVTLVVALGWVLKEVIPAFGVAVGLGVSVASTGLASAGAPWMAPVAAIGIGGGGGALTIYLLVKAVRSASSEPFPWATAVLGIASAAILDLAKDYALDNSLARIAVTAAIAFLVSVGGACYHKGGFVWRLAALVLYLAPPTTVFIQNVKLDSLRTAFDNFPPGLAIRIGGFIVCGLVIALLHHVAERATKLDSRRTAA
jgi:fluoride ion exporter CrcB/FEX